MKTISMWKNVGWFTPPQKIAREDLPLKSSVWFTPQNHQGRFTPQIICTIYPPPHQIAFISTFLPPKSDIN